MRLIPYLTVFLVIGCQSDSASDLQNDFGPVVNITYSQHIQPIISSNCIQCHSDPPQNGAPMKLTTYDDVRNAVLNRGLIDRITRPEGAAGHMPFGGPKLPDSSINLIIQWQAQGFLQ